MTVCFSASTSLWMRASNFCFRRILKSFMQTTIFWSRPCRLATFSSHSTNCGVCPYCRTDVATRGPSVGCKHTSNKSVWHSKSFANKQDATCTQSTTKKTILHPYLFDVEHKLRRRWRWRERQWHCNGSNSIMVVATLIDYLCRQIDGRHCCGCRRQLPRWWFWSWWFLWPVV